MSSFDQAELKSPLLVFFFSEADRAAISYIFGWKRSPGHYASGVTRENRLTWHEILYVKQHERYWTIGENVGRWEMIRLWEN